MEINEGRWKINWGELWGFCEDGSPERRASVVAPTGATTLRAFIAFCGFGVRKCVI
jgi:hypothetical protein